MPDRDAAAARVAAAATPIRAPSRGSNFSTTPLSLSLSLSPAPSPRLSRAGSETPEHSLSQPQPPPQQSVASDHESDSVLGEQLYVFEPDNADARHRDHAGSAGDAFSDIDYGDLEDNVNFFHDSSDIASTHTSSSDNDDDDDDNALFFDETRHEELPDRSNLAENEHGRESRLRLSSSPSDDVVIIPSRRFRRNVELARRTRRRVQNDYSDDVQVISSTNNQPVSANQTALANTVEDNDDDMALAQRLQAEEYAALQPLNLAMNPDEQVLRPLRSRGRLFVNSLEDYRSHHRGIELMMQHHNDDDDDDDDDNEDLLSNLDTSSVNAYGYRRMMLGEAFAASGIMSGLLGGGVAHNPANYVDDANFDASYENLISLGERVGTARSKGVESSVLESLPKRKFKHGDASGLIAADGESRCSICLMEYDDNDELSGVPCTHWFHSECIRRWLQHSKACPICRTEVTKNANLRSRNNTSAAKAAQKQAAAADSGEWVSQRGPMETSAPYAKAYEEPPFTLKEIRDAVPAWCFKHNTLVSLGYVALDVAMAATQFYIATGIDSGWNGLIDTSSPLVRFALWMIYGVVQGWVCTGIWVLAHALLVPYFSWKITHSKHHKNCSNVDKDQVFIPSLRSEYPSRVRSADQAVPEHGKEEEEEGDMFESPPIFDLLRLVRQQLFGWPSYIIANVSGQKFDVWASHFHSSSPIFDPHHAKQVIMSDIGIAIMLGILGYLAHTYSVMAVVKYYVIPYLWVNHWLVMITYLQHTDVRLPHYRGDDWTFLKGALCTVDRDFGFLNHFFHHITDTHVVHHLFSTMPFYNAEAATEAVKAKLGKFYLYDDSPIFLSMWRSYRNCKFVEDEGGVVFYKR
ncbi:hypothetical protein HDU82_005328 [Entophlyctis luteolus]|nr:hypothetical protein HDU82_005328 [Entophlyctis luteolus]